MKDLLQQLVLKQSAFLELRYHRRVARSFMAQKGRVDTSHQTTTAGVGIRALIDGAWGFSATSDLSRPSLERAIERAKENARELSIARGKRKLQLARGNLASGSFLGAGVHEMTAVPTADKLASVVDFERRLAKSSSYIHTAKARYSEITEEKAIVTTDGAAAEMTVVQPEFSMSAIAERDGSRAISHLSAGVSGDWTCLFAHPALRNVVDDTSKIAVDLTRSKHPEGGVKTVILAPSVVGLLCHEAVGHTVEADFVKAGSVAKGKLGTVVASPLVNMADSGHETLAGYAVGNIPFDDEGVLTQTAQIIKDGVLTSYLHNRESAAEFGVEPTGNARAWLYDDEPIIRMRNTYFLPGTQTLDEILASTEDGYLVEGSDGGQADSNGEFMFGASYLWRIQNGKKTELLREATLSGIAFDVLKSVDAVSKEFRWDLGSGYCGKGQPAKVDAGGPYLRCKMMIGGRS